MHNIYDAAIIGGGMAGLTAGLYAARAGLKAVVFEQFMPGGQAGAIVHLDNYPGFVGGVDGAGLMTAVLQQAEDAGCQILYSGVEKLLPAPTAGQPHTLITPEGRQQALTVIVCGGALPRKLGLEGEQRLTGHGLSYCATCDAPLYRGKVVAVTGSGATAVNDALDLAEQAQKVYLLNPREQLNVVPALRERLSRAAGVELLSNLRVTRLLGERLLEGVELTDVRTSSISHELKLDGLFVALGKSPVSEFLGDVLELDAKGRVITDEHMRTSRPGIFAAGDVRNTVLRQVVTAAADGAVAAVSAAAYLRSLG